MFVAIDWSGRRGADQRRALWLGTACEGALVRLEGGRTRAELVDLLIAAADRDPDLVVGLDFAFSLPAWYLREHRRAPRQLWSALADEALTPAMRHAGLAAWMNRPEPPFWTTAAGHAALGDREPFRRTELDVRAPGVQPKSVFQLVGAGQVGRGSLYGMQALHRLAAAGFSVWPFDPPARPLVVEIFPRLLTRAVVKSSQAARARYLADVALPPALHAHAEASEDAFDAAISALGDGARVRPARRGARLRAGRKDLDPDSGHSQLATRWRTVTVRPPRSLITILTAEVPAGIRTRAWPWPWCMRASTRRPAVTFALRSSRR